MVTNFRRDEPLTVEKLNFIIARIPTLYSHLTDDQYYVMKDNVLGVVKAKVKAIHKPYIPAQGDTDQTKMVWKLYTGSNCPVRKPPRPNTAQTNSGRAGQPVAPPHIPPVVLEMPWHPDGPEEMHFELPQMTEFNHQVLPDSGTRIEEMYSLALNSGGEEIPGLWRLSGYNPDHTAYLSAIVKVMERKEKPEERSSSRMQQPPAMRKRRREAEAQDENDETVFKRARIYI